MRAGEVKGAVNDLDTWRLLGSALSAMEDLEVVMPGVHGLEDSWALCERNGWPVRRSSRCGWG